MPRKPKTIHYLYKTTCLVTGRYYIGMHSTSSLEDGYMGSGKRLRYSIRKHGNENHVKEILEFFGSRELLVEAERNAITPDMLDDDMCMNLVKGGEGGNLLTDEERKIVVLLGGAAFKEKLSTNLEFREHRGKEISKRNVLYHKLKILPAPPNWSGKKHSKDSKLKIAQSKAGQGKAEKNSQYGTCWITKDGVNKKIKLNSLHTYILDGWIKGRK